ncbi:hypothetical protein [Paenibacillus puerhi]|uniref:hypothetical protein n=1 Tax=Paenibacillus puerhi TaxID=2692622 RepID=UPI00135A2202|nr:hypothetical protein [Paenibacillus puerhi]
MENLTAYFDNQSDLELAAAALREQGAVDIKTAAADSPDNGFMDGQPHSLQAGALEHSAPLNRLQVVVESSRRRQAEDTIAHWGGKL